MSREEEHIEVDSREIPSSLLGPWRDIPDNYVSAYHYTNKDALVGIAQGGLVPFAKRDSTLPVEAGERHDAAFEQLCDELASQINSPLRRSTVVFGALPPSADRSNWRRFGEVPLEIKIDPETTYVYDRRLHSAARLAYYRTQEGQRWLEEDPDLQPGSTKRRELDRLLIEEFPDDWQSYLVRYLSSGVKLVDYLAVSSEEQRDLAYTPEVVLSRVNPQHIRFA
jgi:hypothetical protein